MSWVHIPHANMADTLNRPHSEAVFNAALNIAQKPDVTVDELRELLDVIEREVIALLSDTQTCTYEPSAFGDGHLWYTCSECGGHVSAEYDPPNYCPHCGRKIEQEEENEAG